MTLVSSDYHLDCMETIEKRMPEQSLLKPVLRVAKELKLLRAGYPFLKGCDKIQKWRGRIYRIANDLIVTRVNVEGILEGSVGEVLPQNVEDFRNNLIVISNILHKSCSEDPIVRNLQIEVTRSLTSLFPFYFQLADAAQGKNLSKRIKDFLRLHYGIFSDEIEKTNKVSDPDEPL